MRISAPLICFNLLSVVIMNRFCVKVRQKGIIVDVLLKNALIPHLDKKKDAFSRQAYVWIAATWSVCTVRMKHVNISGLPQRPLTFQIHTMNERTGQDYIDF